MGLWRNPFRRRKPEEGQWTRRDAALENAPWSPLSDLDEGDGAYAPLPPSQYDAPRYDNTGPDRSDYDPSGYDQDGYAPSRYSRGLRRFMPKFLRDRSYLWWISRIIAAVLAIFIVLVAYLAITAPLGKSLEPIAPPQITLLSADGTPIARNGAMVDEPVEIAELPDHVTQPFLAIEDRRFYDHWGVDPRGVGRALFTGVGGGSTITQQLAKFTFLTPERSLSRKAREALIAFWLEAWLTKDEILERYLSNAYFGDNMYGLRAASLHYFYRQPENLRPEQAAMLAGLLQAPSRLAPTRNPDLAAQRYGLVKNAMVAAGYVSQEEADAMGVPALDVRTSYDVPTGTYFADWALPTARERGSATYSRETITTTLDSQMQAAARSAVDRAALGSAQVALVAMRPNGEVVAMVGGRDYSQSAFNRATQARRQPGSTFKLFVYLAALRSGWRPDDEIDNTAFEAGSYRPGNYNDRYSDSITLREAFAQSSNVAAVRLFNEVGSEAVIETARDLGVSSALTAGDPSMALGTSTMSLLELTAAYAAIAADSFPVEPHAFAREEESWFDWAFNGRGSFNRSDLADMEDLLRAAINSGTGRAATLSVPNFGKTGTTQDNRDALFVGFAGEGADRLVVGVWVGNDDNSPLDGITGGGVPARIWRDFMRSALGVAATPPRPVPSPDPSGPVQPQDVIDLEDIPIGERSRISVRDGEAVLQSEIEGIPLRIGVRDGELSVDIDDEDDRPPPRQQLEQQPQGAGP